MTISRHTGRDATVPSRVTYAPIMDSDWAVFVEDNKINREQKYLFPSSLKKKMRRRKKNEHRICPFPESMSGCTDYKHEILSNVDLLDRRSSKVEVFDTERIALYVRKPVVHSIYSNSAGNRHRRKLPGGHVHFVCASHFFSQSATQTGSVENEDPEHKDRRPKP